MNAINFIKQHGVDKARLVFGVGVNDLGRSTWLAAEKRHTTEYKLWQNMLERAYSQKCHERKPTYIGTTVDPRWLSLKAFLEDVSKIKGFDKALTEGWQLDKDIISKGSKHYSLDTCCFVPKAINVLITNSKASRGKYPIGVFYSSRDKKYQSCLKIDNKNKFLGSFPTPTDAFMAYKKAKEDQIKVVAERYKDQIDQRAYQALLSFTIEITD